jgi:hypothetical protein
MEVSTRKHRKVCLIFHSKDAENDLRTALTQLRRRLHRGHWKKQVIILIQNSTARIGLPLSEVLGRGSNTRLRGSDSQPWGSKAELRVVPVRRHRAVGQVDGVVAWKADDSLLEAADSIAPVGPVVALSRKAQDVTEWTSIWQPRCAGLRLRRGQSLMNNRVVAAALASLTSVVNLSSGIDHPGDRSIAVDYIWMMIWAGLWDDPDRMRRWLRALGWMPQDARRFEALARKIHGALCARSRRSLSQRRAMLNGWMRQANKVQLNGWVV